jgi:glucokinase
MTTGTMTTGSLAIGIDLGGTQLRVGLLDEAGAVLARAAALTDVTGGPEAVLAQCLVLIAEVSAGATNAIAAVGISAPGPLDSGAGIILKIPTLPGWDDFPIRDRLQAAVSRPVVLENDGIAAAFGEWQHGAGVGLQHLVYVTVSTGIGGGVVVDGRLLHGRRGMAAHVGHFQMQPDGPRCACGALGCFEALAAGTALDKAAQRAAIAEPQSLLAAMGQAEPLRARHVVAAARQGDPTAQRLLAQEAAFLGTGFTALIHLYSPERVIMGGGVSAAFDLLEPGIHAVIQRQAMPAFRDVPVVPASLGDNAGLVGVAALALARAR